MKCSINASSAADKEGSKVEIKPLTKLTGTYSALTCSLLVLYTGGRKHVFASKESVVESVGLALSCSTHNADNSGGSDIGNTAQSRSQCLGRVYLEFSTGVEQFKGIMFVAAKVQRLEAVVVPQSCWVKNKILKN